MKDPFFLLDTNVVLALAIDLYSHEHPDGARNMGKNDLWIAACAKAAGATLLTTDKDFSHLSAQLLEVEYVDPLSRL